ncbi:alkaline phosphatase family protein [Halobellus inordinatus]|uniref:alkaline phosphatase family protein n=1 Tax=Halobellus inordinatus TaxID=1126236 RepID=UPI002109629F|nr:alkaline phosphatase family protein [Halobellus inordinatus]
MTSSTTGQSDDTNRSVLLVGWDGAPHTLVEELIEDGELPTLAGIADDGYFGPLHTVPYIMSSCAWSTFLTGKNAGKHGVYDFYANDFREGTYFREPINATDRDGEELGEILTRNDRSIGQINVPVTYPAAKVDEFEVTGMLTPSVDSDGFCHPSDFLDDFEEIDRYRIDLDEGKDAEKDEFVAEMKDVVDARMELVLYSLERSADVDVYFAVFVAPDRLSHYYWHFHDQSHPFTGNESEEDLEQFSDVLVDLFVNLDDKLAQIIDKFERVNGTEPLVSVVSDHGMRSLERILHVNKWLSEEGYLTFREGEREAVDEDIEEMLDDRVEYIFGKVDWEQTEAYAMGKRGAIYVNEEGREPEGSVPSEERENVIKRLTADLAEIRDPDTDENIVEAVHTRKELFEGPYVDKAPDVLLSLSEGYYPFGYAFELEKDNIISTNDWEGMPFVTGIEDGPGIVGIAGPGVDDTASELDLGLADITPTILHYLGLPVPEDMDGRVAHELFSDELSEDVTYERAVEQARANDSERDADSVKDRLEDLGYL